MRYFISISLLLLYLAVWIRPYYPYIEYTVNKEYIAQNLCENKDKPKMQCDGKCHLAKQIEKASEEEQNPSKPFTPPKTEVKETLAIADLAVWKPLIQNVTTTKQSSYTLLFLPQSFVETPTPPPKYFRS